MSGRCPYLAHLFTRAGNDCTRGHSKTLFKPGHVTDVRAGYFSIRVVGSWNSLPGEVVSASSLPSFKRKLREFWGDILFEFLQLVVWLMLLFSLPPY